MPNREIGPILSLLDSGEWGELQLVINELTNAAFELREAESDFSAKFERAEQKRLKLFEKRFLASKLGICQTHWWSPGADQTDILPLDNLKIVRKKDFDFMACANCIKTSCQPSGGLEETGKCLTPEQAWAMMTIPQQYKMARHFKMPSLRDFQPV